MPLLYYASVHWDIANADQKPRSLPTGKVGPVRALAMLPTGATLVHGGEPGGHLHLIDVNDARSRSVAMADQTSVVSLAVPRWVWSPPSRPTTSP